MIKITDSKFNHTVGCHELKLENDDVILLSENELVKWISFPYEVEEVESVFDKVYFPILSETETTDDIAEILGFELNVKIEEMDKMEKVTFEGIEYTLTQEAYIAGTNDNPHYEASAVDSEGNEYEVIWDVKENWKELDDESNMCDWDNPSEVNKI